MPASNNINITDAQIAFKNFSGKPGKYNNAGNRNFIVFIDDEVMVNELLNDGWNVKFMRPREEGLPERPYLSVGVSYKAYPPQIFLVTSKSKTLLNEETVGMLDWAEIKRVDLSIRPYNWELNGDSGVKGYVKTMYVTIQEDPFAEMYEDVPDSAMSSLIDNG